jgi:hypothetical protein
LVTHNLKTPKAALRATMILHFLCGFKIRLFQAQRKGAPGAGVFRLSVLVALE